MTDEIVMKIRVYFRDQPYTAAAAIGLLWEQVGFADSQALGQMAAVNEIEKGSVWILAAIVGVLSVAVVAIATGLFYRRKYESALSQSEAKYKDLFEHSTDIIYTHDLDGNYTSANAAAHKLLGYTLEEFTQMNFRQVVVPEFVPRTEDFFRMKVEGKADSTGPYELLLHAKGGKKVWVEVNSRIMKKDGTPIGVHGTARDISERRNIELALADAEKRYRQLVENAQDMIVEMNHEGIFTFVNPVTSRITGYSDSELLGTHYLDLVAPEYREATSSYYKSQSENREPVTYFEIPIVTKDGRRLWLGQHVRLILGAEGAIRAEAIARDITHRKTTAEAVIASERKHRELYRMVRLMCDNVPDMIWAKDLEKRYIFANRSTCADLLGTDDTGEPVGKTDLYFAEKERASHPENAEWHTFGEICADSDNVVMKERTPSRFDEFGNVKGKFMFLDVYKAPFWDEHGNMIGTVGCARVVTEQRRIEEERARLVTAIEQTVDSIMVTDVAGNILFVNPAFEQTTGYSRKEVLGKNPRILNSGKHEPAFYQELWRTLRSKQVWQGHFINEKKDGTLYEEEASIAPVLGADGRVISYVAVKRDVTREMALQKELLHAQKMEAVGTLAGGIAHDLNNILQVILGYCDLMARRNSLTDRDAKDLQSIAGAARRGGDLVSRVLTFSRRFDIEARPTDLNEEVRRVHELLLRTIPKMIEIELALAGDINLIHGDPTQIEQIIMNLSINAAHAMPEGGTLTIETANVSLDQDFCRRHAEAIPGNYVLLTVSDTGHGMESKVLDRIFEPFFTTKTLGHGTGLGLPMVYGIVCRHRGLILCHSEPNRGARFDIYFPQMQSSTEVSEPDGTYSELQGHETILLVDDEEQLRSLAQEAFLGYGYRVYLAATGEHALQIYADYADEIDIVILDLVMPGFGGRKCLERLKQMNQDVRVVVASGFATDETVNQVLKEGAAGFMRKPYDFEDLLRQIRAIFDHPTGDSDS